MANKTATFKVNLAYRDTFNNAIAVPQQTCSVTYTAENIGEIDVAAGTEEETVYTVPLGGVEVPTFIWIVSRQ